MKNVIDPEKITTKAYGEILKVDNELIGTPDYMGASYFWNYDYRHYMRDASFLIRQKVHKYFMDAALPTDGTSDQHLKIILKYCKP